MPTAFPQLWKVFTVKRASPGLELLEKRTTHILFHLHWWNINIVVATFLWHSASEYAKKSYLKMIFILYMVLCFPAHWPNLKFKNHCSLVHIHYEGKWRGSSFLGPNWHSPIGSMPFHRAQKTLECQGPTPPPPTSPSNGYSRIKNHMHRAV